MSCPSSDYGTHRCVRCDSEVEDAEDLRARVAELEADLARVSANRGELVFAVASAVEERDAARAEVERLMLTRDELAREVSRQAQDVESYKAEVERVATSLSVVLGCSLDHAKRLPEKLTIGRINLPAEVERLRAFAHEAQAVAVQWSEKNDKLREALADVLDAMADAGIEQAAHVAWEAGHAALAGAQGETRCTYHQHPSPACPMCAGLLARPTQGETRSVADDLRGLADDQEELETRREQDRALAERVRKAIAKYIRVSPRFEGALTTPADGSLLGRVAQDIENLDLAALLKKES